MGGQRHDGNKNVQLGYKMFPRTSINLSICPQCLPTQFQTCQRPALKEAHRNEENMKGVEVKKTS